MGVVISFLQGLTEEIKKENKSKLYIGGLIITFIVVSLSGISGWIIERLFLFFEIKNPILSTLFFAFILSSSLASRSLNKSILEILTLISKENISDNISNLRTYSEIKKDSRFIFFNPYDPSELSNKMELVIDNQLEEPQGIDYKMPYLSFLNNFIDELFESNSS